MQRISGTKIQLTRGDTFKATISMIDSAGQPYEPQAGDVIRFAMKKSYTDNEVLIEKVIPNDTLLLRIESNDTKELPFGKYVYDIQITYAYGDIDTFIDRSEIELTEEVD